MLRSNSLILINNEQMAAFSIIIELYKFLKRFAWTQTTIKVILFPALLFLVVDRK